MADFVLEIYYDHVFNYATCLLKISTKLHAQSTKVLYHIIEKFVVELFPPTKYFYPSLINNHIRNIKFNYEFADLRDFQTSEILIIKNKEDINSILDPPNELRSSGWEHLGCSLPAFLCFIKNHLLNIEAHKVKSSTESDFECENLSDNEDIFSLSDDTESFPSSLSDGDEDEDYYDDEK